jgi:energy-coupling factor transporter ATP-binding protein EcfA2
MEGHGSRTLADRVAAMRRDLFVGRDRELALFRDALTSSEPPFAILSITGPGGVGKSTLLRQFEHLATEAGAHPILVDGHTVDPTPAGFLAAAGLAPGATLPGRTIFLVDHWERLQDLEGCRCSVTLSA